MCGTCGFVRRSHLDDLEDSQRKARVVTALTAAAARHRCGRPALAQQLQRATLAAQDEAFRAFAPRHRGSEIVINRLQPDVAHLLLERDGMTGIFPARVEPRVDHLVQERFAQRLGMALEVLGREFDQRRLIRYAAREIPETAVVRDPVSGNLTTEPFVVELREKQLEFGRIRQHRSRGFVRRRENIPLVNGGPARGLPPRIYVPIVIVAALVFLGIVGYFLRIGLGVTGAALGPTAQQGDANIRATAAPADTLPTTQPGDVVVPQTGGNGVGGGTPLPAQAAGPPAPIARLLTDLRDRLQRNPNDLGALVNLADLYFDAGKFAQALPYYKRAIALDPDNPDTRTDYATALHGAGQDLASIHELESVLARHPGFPEALFNEGIVASAIGRRSEAIGAFTKFLAVAPKDRRAADARTALHNLGAA